MTTRKRFNLLFEGYWNALDIGCSRAGSRAVPDEAGICCTYAGEYDLARGRVIPRRLLRIEECLAAHERLAENLARTGPETTIAALLGEGEQLCFSFAPLVFGRAQASSALIFRHKPPGNPGDRFSFHYEPTEVIVAGKAAFLDQSFIVPDPYGDPAHVSSIFSIGEREREERFRDAG